MNLFCKLGFHNYETIQHITPREIVEILYDHQTAQVLFKEMDALYFCHTFRDCICRSCCHTHEGIDAGMKEVKQIADAKLAERDQRLNALYAARQRVRAFKKSLSGE
jgi:hypothetical protein